MNYDYFSLVGKGDEMFGWKVGKDCFSLLSIGGGVKSSTIEILKRIKVTYCRCKFKIGTTSTRGASHII
jgi:hypothetical protein